MALIRDIFQVQTGYTFRDAINEIATGDTAIIQAGDINAARLSGVARITFNGDKHLLNAGDILLSARGKSVAHTITFDLLPAVAASSVVVLRPKSDINSKFVAQYLNSSTGQTALARITSGSYIKTLRKAELENLLIPLPSDSKQRVIVELNDVIEKYQEGLRMKNELLLDIQNQVLKAQGEIT